MPEHVLWRQGLKRSALLLHLILLIHMAFLTSLVKTVFISILLYAVILFNLAQVTYALRKGFNLDIPKATQNTTRDLQRAIILLSSSIPIWLFQQWIPTQSNIEIATLGEIIVFLINSISGVTLIIWCAYASNSILGSIYIRRQNQQPK